MKIMLCGLIGLILTGCAAEPLPTPPPTPPEHPQITRFKMTKRVLAMPCPQTGSMLGWSTTDVRELAALVEFLHRPDVDKFIRSMDEINAHWGKIARKYITECMRIT